jgi:hypothetical protein
MEVNLAVKKVGKKSLSVQVDPELAKKRSERFGNIQNVV